MRKRVTPLFVVAVLGLILASPVCADVPLYDNGPLGLIHSSWNIYNPFWTSNSFILNSTSNLTMAQVGLWVPAGVTPVSLTWSIGTFADDNSLGSGAVTLANTIYAQNVNGTYDIYESTFSLSDSLSAGTYWLTLQDGVNSAGNTGIVQPMMWGSSDGPSIAFRNGELLPYSESFQIYGTASAVPEPSTMLLLGSGLLGLAGYGRKKFFKK